MSQEYREILSQFEADVNEAIELAYVDHGYVDADGEWSDEAMKAKAFDAFLNCCVVNTKAERSKKALTHGEFYSLVFPQGPGAGEEAPDLDPIEENVLKKLSSTVWGLTQTRRSGYLQRNLETEGETLVLCRCKVYRYAEPKQAVYATNNETLILEDAVDKEIQSLVRRASSLRRDLSMIVERHPALEAAVTKQLSIELKRVGAELTITAGKSNGSSKELAAESAS